MTTSIFPLYSTVNPMMALKKNQKSPEKSVVRLNPGDENLQKIPSMSIFKTTGFPRHSARIHAAKAITPGLVAFHSAEAGKCKGGFQVLRKGPFTLTSFYRLAWDCF